MDQLSWVPETQQAAGVEELVVGLEDPLQLSDTEQGDIRLKTQHDSDTSDTQDTQAAGGTQSGKGKGKGKADKRSKKPAVLFSAAEEQKLVEFLCDNELLYNKHLMDYKNRSKRELVWDKICKENNLDKDACQRWFQSLRTIFGKVTHMKSGQGEPQLMERQRWTRDNFHFLRDHIVHHLTAKSEFRPPKGFISSPCSSGLIIQMGDCAHRTIRG